MDTVTYPHPEVQNELARWIERRADVVVERELAATFGIATIPTAVLLDHDGRILDRVVGFVQPDEFRNRLSAVRSGLPSTGSR